VRTLVSGSFAALSLHPMTVITWTIRAHGEVAVREIATSDNDAFDPDMLIETDSRVLEQVRKDLSQEYARFMSRLIQKGLGMQAGRSTSVFDHLRKASSGSSTGTGSS
jgi:hypothetical protein